MEQDIAVVTTVLPDPGRSQVQANVQVEVEEVVEDGCDHIGHRSQTRPVSTISPNMPRTC